MRGYPVEVTAAFCRLRNLFEATDVELGGAGVFEDDAEITPPTGTEIYDTGSIIRYTVDTAFTQDTGTYVLFTTAVFADGTRKTENRKFSVLELK
jgi:hypothetical protein